MSVAELKLRQRLLEQQVALVDKKAHRAMEILERRKAARAPPSAASNPSNREALGNRTNPLIEERMRRKLAQVGGGVRSNQVDGNDG